MNPLVLDRLKTSQDNNGIDVAKDLCGNGVGLPFEKKITYGFGALWRRKGKVIHHR
jgi:hypothetical protein